MVSGVDVQIARHDDVKIHSSDTGRCGDAGVCDSCRFAGFCSCGPTWASRIFRSIRLSVASCSSISPAADRADQLDAGYGDIERNGNGDKRVRQPELCRPDQQQSRNRGGAGDGIGDQMPAVGFQSEGGLPASGSNQVGARPRRWRSVRWSSRPVQSPTRWCRRC